MAVIDDFLEPIDLDIVCSDFVTFKKIWLDFKSPTEFKVRGMSPNAIGEYVVKPATETTPALTFNVVDIYKHGGFLESFKIIYAELEWQNN